jgi:hypothetical protein
MKTLCNSYGCYWIKSTVSAVGYENITVYRTHIFHWSKVILQMHEFSFSISYAAVQDVPHNVQPATTAYRRSSWKWVSYNAEHSSHVSKWVSSYAGHCLLQYCVGLYFQFRLYKISYIIFIYNIIYIHILYSYYSYYYSYHIILFILYSYIIFMYYIYSYIYYIYKISYII